MKGICFIEPLHIKVVCEKKMMTRRIIKPQPFESDTFKWYGEKDIRYKPRYKRGETLYLKEPYCLDCDLIQQEDSIELKHNGNILYKYSDDEIPEHAKGSLRFGKWQNKLFMPEKYARDYIKITNVRAERLQDISDEDCIKEGIIEFKTTNLKTYYSPVGCYVTPDYDNILTPKKAYAALIDSICGKGTWESNPIVWAYDFKLITK
jgi:hypothetical protein